ncbi:MAG: hypothetical protein UV40_C0014G0015 [Parcubacteria group bacterium GW2011_GWA1_42_7]|nr:MAG: hypothetical protein UV34_C0008G0003 [Parcubacteria group bacterium GW2011_GWB1_42_6]KKS69805.1 MAG: hypothetical protein UV40_C0014G0015 [Parcubacteria group bacterium GW2011_GWA1_42_7]
MNKKISQKNQPITKGYLDKSLKEYTETIIEVMDFGFEKNKKEHEEMRKINSNLEKKIDDTKTLLDGYVNAQEGFKQEFEIVKYRQSKVEKVIKSKLGVEIE